MSDDLIDLTTICTEYFGITPDTAKRRAALGVLPVPAFRLSSSGKGPIFVRRTDLDKLVAEQVEKAVALNSQMRLAGAV